MTSHRFPGTSPRAGPIMHDELYRTPQGAVVTLEDWLSARHRGNLTTVEHLCHRLSRLLRTRRHRPGAGQLPLDTVLRHELVTELRTATLAIDDDRLAFPEMTNLELVTFATLLSGRLVRALHVS